MASRLPWQRDGWPGRSDKQRRKSSRSAEDRQKTLSLTYKPPSPSTSSCPASKRRHSEPSALYPLRLRNWGTQTRRTMVREKCSFAPLALPRRRTQETRNSVLSASACVATVNKKKKSCLATCQKIQPATAFRFVWLSPEFTLTWLSENKRPLVILNQRIYSPETRQAHSINSVYHHGIG